MDQDTIHIPRLSPNQKPHPTRPGYNVYYFKKDEEADYFQSLLEEKKVFFERAHQDEDPLMKHLFGVRTTDEEEVNQLNFLTKGKFRRNIMPVRWFAVTVIVFGLLLLGFAIVGAVMSK